MDRYPEQARPVVIDCVGEGLSRGRSHGESARMLVRDTIARWEDATRRASGSAIEQYVQEFLTSTSLAATLGSLMPDLLDEIRGIAEGAALPFETVLAFNLMDEQWWFDLERSPTLEPGCSVVAIFPDEGRPALLAQNMDLPAFMDGGQVVLRIASPGQPEALVLSSAGLVGLTGVNRVGLGICVNTLLMLDHSRSGLPVAAVLRALITKTRPQDALALLRSVPHASGQHYAIGSSLGVVGVECSATGAVVCAPFGRSALIHTNHPRASCHIDAGAERYLAGKGRLEDSKRRLAFLDAKVVSLSGPRDVKRVLADRSTPIRVLPTAERQGKTFGSVLFELSDVPRASFCLGSSDNWAWHQVPWMRDT